VDIRDGVLLNAGKVKQRTQTILTEINQTMFGMDRVARLCLTALFSGGHVLLEGNPGLGKTKLVKTLEKTLKLPYKRIQFTPDLMPSDITGSLMPNPDDRHRLVFQEGPIFTSLLLADEINRATPKTQAAMLEAMAERSVTVLGRQRRLNRPFMVLATQNPVDHEGVYPLPEAQADRFMFKIAMPFPNADTLKRIMNAKAGPSETIEADDSLSGETNRQARDSTEAPPWFDQIQGQIKRVKPTPALETHIVNMLLASNGYHEQLEGVDRRQQDTLKKLADRLFVYGLGPRVAEDLLMASKAWSLMFLRQAQEEFAGPEALANVAMPVLRHRIKKVYDWEEGYAEINKLDLREDEPRDGLLETLLVEFCAAAAPQGKGGSYRQSLGHILHPMASPRWVKRGGLF